ncbi:2-succinyl-5-enolpyruvyl-6-hydroxy-3-cyclohexene-1-carboxylate synthase [Bhargavaea cecembensis]|uniref:2-succinyl-5-enolpyruvyl-6-hydroxy-3-cyclohexene-1-carboxylate synthase n=1 Tax=Bhargavaea cecembensis TaxID=394098 RepID=A0A161RHY9_9BACL|nr:2-succinyl-5-enolpyruvyl-6-hydroxy-3-cyclohexene-1-carboxylic-acid synthase [Bhargavaea cecembensis]KZE39742.1 2-succinyl-5-enolpyruvyl-6-hydroxy-3-cyclohexene-1-carboxylate synthase [Bhargavaea cecembensis]
MDDRKILTSYVLRIRESLIRAGVRHVVVSPGSRSTPLAYAFADSDSVSIHLQTDERSAAFCGLGMAKASGEPVAVLCTSGTAASNYMPAVTEAKYARVPLIVLTADRPHELREVGAPQAIDQPGMYGRMVKYSADFPVPEDRTESLEYIGRHVQRAVSVATDAPAGPVHLNIPFREPLLIEFGAEDPGLSFRSVRRGMMIPDPEMVRWFTETAAAAERGLIIAGELPPGFDKETFWKFARSLGWPVLADPLSGLRSGISGEAEALCIDLYDAILKNERFKQEMAPDTVIRFGPQPVSKPLTQFLNGNRPGVYMVVDESPSFRDPYHLATDHLQCAPEMLLEIRAGNAPSEYAALWSEANRIATEETRRALNEGTDEGAMAGVLFDDMPDGSDLFASSSMPIRDVDTFFMQTDRDIGIFANRGVNGIDGVVSTAFGVQAARRRPAYLLIGDLAMLHDMNGLISSRFDETDLTILVMNNDGGGIFSYLPQAGAGRYFEELFGTPTGLKFRGLADMYGCQYDAVESADGLRNALRQPKQTNVRIIEAFSDRQVNLKEHRKLWQAISERLDAEWKH